MRAFSFCVCVAVCASLLGTSCVFVQLKTTGSVLAVDDDRVALYDYESVDTAPLTGLAIACILTATLYGGACWAYAAVPFDGQVSEQRNLARADVRRDLPCGRLLDIDVEAVGWSVTRRAFAINEGARTFSPAELQALCRRDPAQAQSMTPATTTPTPPPPPPSPKTEPSSVEEWLQDLTAPRDPAG